MITESIITTTDKRGRSMLKNIFKLSFTNFKEVWKVLLYRVIYFLFVLGLTTVASWNIIKTLIKENFFVNLQTNFKEVED